MKNREYLNLRLGELAVLWINCPEGTRQKEILERNYKRLVSEWSALINK